MMGFISYSNSAMADTTKSQGEICNRLIRYVEQKQAIPDGLLKSIALTESGRRDPVTRQYSPWPWTIMAEGKGRYFNSKEEAIQAAIKLQQRGVRNMDIGCMQVNYGYHGKHFSNSVHNMFDPYQNITYSANFLNRLKKESGLWTKAVGNYHSRTPSRSAWYQNKVFAKWRGQHNKSIDAYAAGNQVNKTLIVRGKSSERKPIINASYEVEKPLTQEQRQYLAANQNTMLEQRRSRQMKIISYD